MSALDFHISKALDFHGNEISKTFECPVLAYVGPIYPDAVQRYIDVIEAIVQDAHSIKYRHSEKLVIVLKTNGGSVEAVEKMVEVTRHHFSEVYFIVPEAAMSAGTIWCMSGDKIWMDYCSSLGPIDPQVFSSKRGGWVPALGYIEKKNELDQKHRNGSLTNADAILLNALDLAELHRCEQARDLSINLLKKWLVEYKFRDWTVHRTNNPNTPVTQQEKVCRAEQIARDLMNNLKWHSHGRFIGMKTLISDLRLEIDDFSGLKNITENARMYVGLLTDYMGSQVDTPIIHRPRGDI